MAKRNKAPYNQFNFFPTNNPHNPLANIVGAVGNTFVTLGIRRLSKDLAQALGLGGMSVADEIQLHRSRLSVAKQEGDNTRATLIGERQIKLLDYKIQQKEYNMQKAMERLENTEAQRLEVSTYPRTEIISGALEVAADPGGIAASGEQKEGYTAWLDSCQDGKVILILGRRGSGKTALAAKIAEYAMARYRMPIYWIGLPESARELLPHWITLVDSPEQCPMGCFMIIDEAGIQYLSLAFNTDRNRLLRGLLMVCRHRHCSLVFAVQSSRDLEYSIVRQADSLIFKQPSLHQPDSERPDIRPMAKKAALIFKEIPKENRIESAYVLDDDFQGIITSSVPSFWKERLSCIYSNFDLAAIENQVRRGNELKKIVVEETKLLDAASLEKKIMELRRESYGIERIAKTLNCSTWQVRKVLGSVR